MKTIFTTSLFPTENWFNSIQNLEFKGGCQDGQYPLICWPSLLSSDFTGRYSRTTDSKISKTFFAGGLLVPSPTGQFSLINNAFLAQTLVTSQLTVSTPGSWISYQDGVLSCPNRARVQTEPGADTVDTVFGFKAKTWVLRYSANAPTKNGVSFGNSRFTISGVPSEPHSVQVSAIPEAEGGEELLVGLVYHSWSWVNGSLVITGIQSGTRSYQVVAIY